MDKRVRAILQDSYNEIFKLMREKMVFEERQEAEVQETISVLLDIEKLARVQPNEFFKLATKKG